jgi:hypothetical protein
MECVVDIQHYNDMIQEDRVYVFLDGLDDKLDKIWVDILQMHLFPTIERAYAHVCREAVRQAVMITRDSTDTHGAVLASRSFKPEQSPLTKSLSLSNGKAENPKTRAPSDGTQLKCSHCGNLNHTHETCFKLHGYPEWWADLQARERWDATSADGGSGQAVVAMAETQAMTETQLSLSTPNESAEPLVERVSTDLGICSPALLSPSRDDDDKLTTMHG